MRLNSNSRLQSVKTSYTYLLGDLRRLDESGSSPKSGQSLSSPDKLLVHLSGQLCQYITARNEVMELYPSNKKKCYDAKKI